jgi:hypothetical protein
MHRCISRFLTFGSGKHQYLDCMLTGRTMTNESFDPVLEKYEMLADQAVKAV